MDVNGNERPIVATISGVKTTLQGRGTDANDVAKVAGGTAAGAIVGRVLGGSSKGAIIGGIIGGAVGSPARGRDQGPRRRAAAGHGGDADAGR